MVLGQYTNLTILGGGVVYRTTFNVKNRMCVCVCERERERERGGEGERKTRRREREGGRERDRDRETERERDRDRETQRQTDRQTDRQTGREKEVCWPAGHHPDQRTGVRLAWEAAPASAAAVAILVPGLSRT